MSKQTISRIILVLMVLTNIYLIWRVHANTMAIASYDAGISQRSGVGKLESYWTKYIGGAKGSISYEDRSRAEADTSTSVAVLFILDIACVGALYMLNKKPKPVPVEDDDDDWRPPRRGGRSIGNRMRSKR